MIVDNDLFKSVQVTELINSENVNREFGTKDTFGRFTTTTPLHVAVEYDHVSVVEYLLKVGADVDKEDFSQRTPLDVAVSKKVSQCVIVLFHCIKYGYTQ